MDNETDAERFEIYESLNNPVSIIGIDGMLMYGNKAFRQLFQANENDIRLDWEHPFFPEYRRRVAQAYLGARMGEEKQCFAVMNARDGSQMPVEIYLFPMYTDNAVSSILALLKIVDSRMLSFDRSTLSIISEENFQYDNLHFEFSPMPILRINSDGELTRCSQSIEGFLGYSSEEIIEKKTVTSKTIFIYDSERVKRTVSDIIEGIIHFKRIGEVKVASKSGKEKMVNLTLYPIIQNKEISAIEIIMEDITQVRELKDRITAIDRNQLFRDITKGFLHSLNNTINVIMSKTQMLLQVTEKGSVLEGIKIIETSAHEIANQARRVQNFIGDRKEQGLDKIESLVDIIEDSLEFSKIQFKVEDTEKRRHIDIDRKYFTAVDIKTDTRLLREIVISIILEVSTFIQKKGTVEVSLKETNDICLTIKANKDGQGRDTSLVPFAINVFSRMDIRQVAEKLHVKIIEEESAETYSIKAIFPSRVIIDDQKNETENIEYKLRNLDVIIVEDEPALQKILFELFDRMGNRVFICENGDKALEEYKKKHYDLVVTDYDIRGITGIELSARIKEINEETVTILLSGWVLNDLQAYKNVIDLFMPKPFKLDELLKNISKIFKEKKQ
ncbi:MAG: response regulator [bacterium]|nr:response regulator [bacterium]